MLCCKFFSSSNDSQRINKFSFCCCWLQWLVSWINYLMFLLRAFVCVATLKICVFKVTASVCCEEKKMHFREVNLKLCLRSLKWAVLSDDLHICNLITIFFFVAVSMWENYKLFFADHDLINKGNLFYFELYKWKWKCNFYDYNFFWLNKLVIE